MDHQYDWITHLAGMLKAAGVDRDTALNISLRVRKNPEQMIAWLEQHKSATSEEISDKSAEIQKEILTKR